MAQEEFTMGVEEEYHIIDPDSRELSPSALPILERAKHVLGERIQPELRLSQIEVETPVCSTLAEVRSHLQRLRRETISAARQEGKQIASAGTHPFSHWRGQPVTPKERYESLAIDYQQLTREQTISGCHVHVGLHDREIALQVMNRARSWLAPLLALSASSPYWLGEDTGYSSYRTEIWSRWPISGPPLAFTSLQEHNALAQDLINIGAIQDTTKIYWDLRLSERFETIEMRVADACMHIDDAVLIAGLIRAIIRTCYEQVIRQESFTPARHEVLRVAQWTAARYGLSEKLVDVQVAQLVPAQELIEKLLQFTKDALNATGDWEEVSSLAHQTLQQGNSATRQREVYQRTGSLQSVVDFLVTETASNTNA
ncbi:MAG: carboxylate-amine ligase [Ktedonobacteraceae bacterium]|nr:carboxylate-amine ligase [Ktedonobacteraceae bacterium]